MKEIPVVSNFLYANYVNSPSFSDNSLLSEFRTRLSAHSNTANICCLKFQLLLTGTLIGSVIAWVTAHTHTRTAILTIRRGQKAGMLANWWADIPAFLLASNRALASLTPLHHAYFETWKIFGLCF